MEDVLLRNLIKTKLFMNFVKRVHFFFGPLLLVCLFKEISYQVEQIGQVSNFEKQF